MARIGRLGLGALLGPLTMLGAAEPVGAPTRAKPEPRLRPLNGWDAISMRWLTPTVGLPGGLAPLRSGSPIDLSAGRRTALIRDMFRAGDRIARLPYKWGGGHGSFVDSGYDCSGSVSYVLHAAGLLATPEASGALTSYGAPGPGRRVTIYANSAHALVTIDGRRFDTIVLQSTGSRWAPQAGALDGYVERHPAGL